MIILGIDPGPTESAYVIWDGSRVIQHGMSENQLLIKSLNPEVNVTHCAIEMIASYGMSVGQEVFETCVWIGRWLERWEYVSAWSEEGSSFDAIRVTRKDVAVHLCNSARAGDSNVSQALRDRFGEKGTRKNPGATYGIVKDEWSALAVAVTVYDRILSGYYDGEN